MIVFIRTIAAVVVSVTEAPASDTLEVVAAKPSLRVTVDGAADCISLVRTIATIIVTITLPLRRNTDLRHHNESLRTTHHQTKLLGQTDYTRQTKPTLRSN